MMNESAYWPVITKIESLQRMVIVHSIIYYEMDGSVISDARYDALAMELVGMKMEHPAEWARSYYSGYLDDFDGSTGFDLPSRLNDYDRSRLWSIANTVVNLHRKE